jgi:hypothetical protein
MAPRALHCRILATETVEFGCRSNAEGAVAYIQLPRKRQHAGPSSCCDLLAAAAEFPSPAPQQRTVRLRQNLRSVEGGAAVEHASGRRLERPSRTLGDQVANQVAHSAQLVCAIDPAE